MLKHPKESFHNNFVSLDCDQCTMVTQHGKPMFTQVLPAPTASAAPLPGFLCPLGGYSPTGLCILGSWLWLLLRLLRGRGKPL